MILCHSWETHDNRGKGPRHGFGLAEAVVEPLKPAEDVDDNEAKNPDEGTVAENFQRIEEETADESAAPLGGGEAAGLSLPRIPDQLYLGPPRFGGDCR